MPCRHEENVRKLLRGGGQVFALRGYANATVREICTAAGVNVAAVSYYFGGKEKLYISVLEDFLETGERLCPYDDGAFPASAPEEHLRAFVRHLLTTFSGGCGVDDGLRRLLLHECLDPASIAQNLLRSYFDTKRGQLAHILSALHPSCGEGLVRRMCVAVIWQCFQFVYACGPASVLIKDSGLEGQDIEDMCEFLVGLCVGGMAHLGRGWNGNWVEDIPSLAAVST